MAELTIKSIKATGDIIELYNGNFDLREVGNEILNPVTISDIQSALSGATLQYSYNAETSSSKITDLAKLFKPMQLLLGFSTISGVIDNTLDKAGINRETDLDKKVRSMVNSSTPEPEIVSILSKINKVLEIMGEVNDKLRQYKPAGLPESEQYYFRHHFPSPKSLSKTN